MKKIDKKSTPLVVLKALRNTLEQLRSLTNHNLDIVDNYDSDECFFLVRDIDPSSNFFFRLDDIVMVKESEVSFKCTLAPRSDRKLNEIKYTGPARNILQQYQNWMNRIKSYNSIELSEEDKFKKQYEQEFEEMFEIIDEDAEINPFDIARQVFIYRYLEKLISSLQLVDSEKHTEIIGDVKKLQENLQNYTKKDTVRSLSRIWAKIRKNGIKLLLDFFDVGKKELLKKAFNGGLDEVGGLIEKLLL